MVARVRVIVNAPQGTSMSLGARLDGSMDSARPIVCPVEHAIRVIGGKWKMLVLRSLFVVGAQRYNSFLRTVPGISPKELTRNLRELEQAGLVARVRSENGRPDVEVYALTEMGSGLHTAFKALGSFGELLMQKRTVGSK
jgi:DNA-binding HxlR family transcriptional regulator